MPKLALTGGSYQARSVIASAQRCLNLFPEPMLQQQGEPAAFAHYPTPGLRLLSTLPQGPIRGIRQATTGQIYVVAGSGVYLIDPTAWTGSLLGSITSGVTTPVSMQDNTQSMVIVDGSANGWTIDLTSNAFATISDPSGLFAGADRVDYIDTYLVFNKPNTPQFYSSDSLAVTFDNLNFANKSSYTDKLVTLVVAKREIWLLGERTTEVWYDLAAGSSGDISATFPFSEIPSTFIDHGCAAKYSVATYDNSVFWLSRDRSGQGIAMQGAGYQNKRISTFAMEQIWADYATVSDAIGFVYLLGGHIVYVLTFPTADHTWAYDVSTNLWHEWLWTDSLNNEHRHRANCHYHVNGLNVVGDWQSGALYALDHNVFDDAGQPIKRQRAFPHILNDGKRMFYREFLADFETGNAGPYPDHPQGITSCTFAAPDGTLLENYAPHATDFQATWTQRAGSVQITGQQAVQVTGPAIYQLNAVPSLTDYSVAFRVVPLTPLLNDSIATLIGRSPDGANGYGAGIEISGGIYYAMLSGYAAVSCGSAPPDGWFDLSLTMVGPLIALRVQRSSDGLYLHPDGTWTSSADAAITEVDNTYAGPGSVFLTFNAIVTGPMATEDSTGLWTLEDGSTNAWEWDDSSVGNSLAIDNVVASTVPTPWQLWLDWSDDRGHTYGTPVPQTVGGQGEYLTSIQWQRLGYARDRVFRLTWTSPLKTALLGSFIDAQPGLT